MMKKLLLCLVGALSFLSAQAQTISIVGTGVNGWPPTNGPEITLATLDNVTYTITDLVVNTGEVKFRQDLDWAVNWGAASWPAGTGTQGGANIPTVAGTYDVTFNRLTGAYSFVGSAAFDTIGIWGPAVDAVNGFGGNDVELLTNDGITYRLSGFNFTTGAAKFLVNNDPTQAWGAVDFPSGIAVEDGPSINVTGGTWTVTFNAETGAYSFDYPSIGLIGNATGSWDFDINMVTTNGELYTLNAIALVDGFIKFRQDDSWTVNWGGGGENPNVLVPNGGDIAVTAGTYDITFNRLTLEWTLTPSLSTVESARNLFRVFPNPSKNEWNLASTSSTIDTVIVFDLAGKVVMSSAPGANQITLDASALQTGTYFAKITSSSGIQHVKLIRN